MLRVKSNDNTRLSEANWMGRFQFVQSYYFMSSKTDFEIYHNEFHKEYDNWASGSRVKGCTSFQEKLTVDRMGLVTEYKGFWKKLAICPVRMGWVITVFISLHASDGGFIACFLIRKVVKSAFKSVQSHRSMKSKMKKPESNLKKKSLIADLAVAFIFCVCLKFWI